MKRTAADAELIKLRLREKYGKKIEIVQSQPLEQAEIPEGPFECSTCSEAFQRRDIEDFLEHIGVHEAADMMWTLRTQEICGDFDDCLPELVNLTALEWKVYMDGRVSQLIKEFKEISEYETLVKIRQQGDVRSPLPTAEPPKSEAKELNKVLLPAKNRIPKPVGPRIPQKLHYKPPIHGIVPVRPVSRYPGQSMAITSIEVQSPGNSQMINNVQRLAPNNPNFGSPRYSPAGHPQRPIRVGFPIHFNRPINPRLSNFKGPAIIPPGSGRRFVRTIIPARVAPTRGLAPSTSRHPLPRQPIPKPRAQASLTRLHTVGVAKPDTRTDSDSRFSPEF